mgnify:CR=1 FL=1
MVGERIDICCSSPYRDFFTNTRTCYYYASYFSVAENSTILGKIKGTDKVVAAVIPYGSGKIVLLPQIYEEEEYTFIELYYHKPTCSFFYPIYALYQNYTVHLSITYTYYSFSSLVRNS